MKTIRLSVAHARALVEALGDAVLPSHQAQALGALKAGLAHAAPGRSWAQSRRAANEATRATKRAETTEIRAAVEARAQGRCECNCGRPSGRGEMDHFFGRGREPQAVGNCWLLNPQCHREKTNNSPDAEWWLERFAVHCERHGYAAEAKRARQRLASIRDIATAAEVSRHA